MKQAKTLFALVLALVMVVSLALPAFAADDDDPTTPPTLTGSITLNGATIDETYHIYKLFDVTIGAEEDNGTIPTDYIATQDQVTKLSAAQGNVFAFTEQADGSYQVTVGTDSATNNAYTNEKVINFLKTFILSLSDGVTRCNFPGAEEIKGTSNDGIDANGKALSSTVTWKNVPAGYYFVTSSLGSVVTIDTSNPNATISDKNSNVPDWNNEPDEPEENPKKDVQNASGQSIDGEKVGVGQTLTYVISYTYQDDDNDATNNGNATLGSVVITDAAPTGTTYEGSTATILKGTGADTDKVEVGADGTIKWSFANVAKGTTLVVSFQVTVNNEAVQQTEADDHTIINDANVKINNEYDIKTNKVTNPVDDPKNPQKEVQDKQGNDLDGKNVKIGDTLTYKVSYKYTEADATDKDGHKVEKGTVVITDAPPAGTVYLKDTARATRTGTADSANPATIKIEPDGTITWTFNNVAVDETVEAYFDVRVTEAAQEITDETIENEAGVKVNDKPEVTTNKVKNPVGDPDGPVKDVLNDQKQSIDGQNVNVDDTLTYTISYTNNQKDEENGQDVTLDSVVITDAPPTGTVFKEGTATGTRTVKGGTAVALGTANITINEADTITWTFENVAPGEKVDVYFDVTVTDAALNIVTKTIENDALVDVTIGDNTYNLKTNKVKNPVGDKPGDPNPGKVIVNKDGTQTTTSTGSFGDTVSFDIGINAVNKVKGNDDKPVQVEKYFIYDKMDAGLTLKAETMVVTIHGTDYKVKATGSKDGNGVTQYTIGDGVGTLFTQETTNGPTLIEATIKWADVGGDVDGNTTVTALYPNCKLHLTYDAEINANAEIAGDGNHNKVIFDHKTTADTESHEPDPENPKYPSDGDTYHGSDEKVTTTYTYALGIQKYSAETGEPQAGAKFTAVDAGGNAIKADAVEDANGKVLYYNYDKTSTNTEFVTDAKGQIIIKGVNIGTYTFTETEAPSGYNLLTESVSVTAQMDSESVTHNKTEWDVKRYFEAIKEDEFNAYTGDVYTKNEVGGEAKFTLTAKPDNWNNNLYKLVGENAATAGTETETSTVVFPVPVEMVYVLNNAGSLLPGTGGMGTTIFYILGGILVVAAGILLVTKKRMSAER